MGKMMMSNIKSFSNDYLITVFLYEFFNLRLFTVFLTGLIPDNLAFCFVCLKLFYAFENHPT